MWRSNDESKEEGRSVVALVKLQTCNFFSVSLYERSRRGVEVEQDFSLIRKDKRWSWTNPLPLFNEVTQNLWREFFFFTDPVRSLTTSRRTTAIVSTSFLVIVTIETIDGTCRSWYVTFLLISVHLHLPVSWSKLN